MPAVLVHGVPDTERVWHEVRQRLTRTDVIALSLPGFNSEVPLGFGATKEEYLEWIIEQLEKLGEPVDLVGHDWVCILVMRVASLRLDLVRTWAAGSGPVSKNYEWHPLAKIWQTPGVGEQWMANLDQDTFSQQLEAAGLPYRIATEVASRVEDRMKGCILRLYRSAAHVGEEWQPDLEKIKAPGLVFWGAQDEACPERFGDELARDAGADGLLKLDCGHWTQVSRAIEVASALEQHWQEAKV
ncbi:pimeloyl-ACP methyl ester carboxylesterase [Granulicella aggregans]|uniref:Pimeloyl-ACP methyl ester carboxylesterase n=1 Tax=Granulicella aggregans TaxID=474949 RepID=A0A7W8E5V9_9BACT|nr:alpha/beta hydrolase [Granulicella aggregans]MBB5060032.1 pimeloyl-ACP methyl ester carboxylesterase [Granulicella aggregans]